jgi:hypothetical protein
MDSRDWAARCERRIQGQTLIEHRFQWLNDLDYRGHRLHWLETLETLTPAPDGPPESHRFVHLTNLAIDRDNVATLSHTGRLRWTIENQGFLAQKRLGYGLQHKYARRSWLAAKNYYQCLQIAHLVNQLVILSRSFQPLLQGKMTLRHLWQAMSAFLMYGQLCSHTLDALAQRRVQIRLT